LDFSKYFKSNPNPNPGINNLLKSKSNPEGFGFDFRAKIQYTGIRGFLILPRDLEKKNVGKFLFTTHQQEAAVSS
jgi:hypothetical protein